MCGIYHVFLKEGNKNKGGKKSVKDFEFLSKQKPFFVTLAHTVGHNISQVKDIKTCR